MILLQLLIFICGPYERESTDTSMDNICLILIHILYLSGLILNRGQVGCSLDICSSLLLRAQETNDAVFDC